MHVKPEKGFISWRHDFNSRLEMCQILACYFIQHKLPTVLCAHQMKLVTIDSSFINAIRN